MNPVLRKLLSPYCLPTDDLDLLRAQFADYDFGSGFASIGYLRNFPFSSFKIDRSLASGFGSDPKASMLIAGMVHLANGLDMAVTAEGVETEGQAAMFRMAGCHELQGFYFGMPAPLDLLSGLELRSAA
jgi:EAL domain-containing protein (putative c-di-GMP-specific phosphodiesterase class I)